jgi:hypothetical protein
LLGKVFGDRYVDLYYPKPFGALPRSEYRRLPIFFGYGRAFSSAELRYLEPTEFWPGARFVTLIRDPCEQVFSAYQHHLRGNDEFATAAQLPGYFASLESFLGEPRNCNTNVQFYSTLRCEDRSCSLAERLEIAKEELVKYDYIGATDRFDELIAMLAVEYPEIGTPYTRHHTNPERSGGVRYVDEVEPAQLDMMREHIASDLDFYDFASDLCKTRWSEHLSRARKAAPAGAADMPQARPMMASVTASGATAPSPARLANLAVASVADRTHPK